MGKKLKAYKKKDEKQIFAVSPIAEDVFFHYVFNK